MTKQLAEFFDHVYAIDISEHVIQYARTRVTAENVEFAVIDGLHLPQADCSMNAIFSTHVLQHLDSVHIGFSQFREFYRVLNPGGTVMVHLPLYQFPNDTGRVGRLSQIIWTAYRRFDDIVAGIRRRAGSKMMRGTPYPIRLLFAVLNDLGYKHIEFRIFPVSSNGELHSFIFATK